MPLPPRDATTGRFLEAKVKAVSSQTNAVGRGQPAPKATKVAAPPTPPVKQGKSPVKAAPTSGRYPTPKTAVTAKKK